MAIKKIEDIKINGKNTAFGGYIYALDLDVSVGKEPSKITIYFVNETGVYLNPVLSTTQPYKIQIGNFFDSNYFAISSAFHKSSDGRTLEVTFYDGSIILDQIWVGLNKKMGMESNNALPANVDFKVSLDKLGKFNSNYSSSAIESYIKRYQFKSDNSSKDPYYILVGNDVHPCDINKNGFLDTEDVAKLVYDGTDPCELRCPGLENTREPIIENCLEQSITQLFDVEYKFQDLLTILNNHPKVKISKIPAISNSFYTASYTGTLRDVLNNWCADFGWTFYWEDDRINFVDATKPIRINFTPSSNLESLSVSHTLEGTFARGSISHFGEPGIKAQVNCSQSQPYLLKCLNFEDLFGNSYKPSRFALTYKQGDEGPRTGEVPAPAPDATFDENNQLEYKDDIRPQGMPIDSFEASCVCAFYSEELRHLYNFFSYYELKTPSDVAAALNKSLDRLGQMKIYKVISPDINKTDYDSWSSNPTLPGSTLSLFSKNSDEYENFKKLKGYFVLAKFNEDLLSKQFQIEQRLATDFFGQHWYRAYASPFIGASPQITPNGQYFGALATDLKDVPFSQFQHEYKSNVYKMLQSFIQKQRNDFRSYNHSRFDTQAVQYNKKILKSILYLRKNPVWSPLKESISDIKNLLNEKRPLLFKKFDLDQSMIEAYTKSLVTDGLVKETELKDIKILAFYPGSLKVSTSFDDNATDEEMHFIEGLESFSVASVGLQSKKCVKYDIGGVQVYTPAGGGVKFKTDLFRFGLREANAIENNPNRPAYKVYVTESSTNRGLIPKVESVLVKKAPIGSTTLRTEYSLREINKGAVRYLASTTAPECILNPATIKQAHEDFARNLDFSITEPFETQTFTVIGLSIPNKIKIKNGLQNISVRIDERGVSTNITVGNSLFIPPSPNFISQQIEFGIPSYARNNRLNPI